MRLKIPVRVRDDAEYDKFLSPEVQQARRMERRLEALEEKVDRLLLLFDSEDGD